MIKKKKITIISTTELTIRSFLLEHIKQLKKLNYEIYLLCNFQNNKKFYRKLNIKLININFKRKIKLFFDLFSLIKLIRELIKISPYLTISISPKAGFLNSIASYLLRTKCRLHIFTGQVWANKFGIFRYFLIALDSVICNLSTHILLDSNSQKKILINKKILKKKTFSKVIYNGSICGVDTNKFKKNLIIRSHVRKKLRINQKNILLIYVGRLNKEKGINKLIITFNILLKKHNNIKLLLIGLDEMGLKNQIINKNIIIHNYTSNIVQYLQASDIFCFPSEREGFGLSVLEASSCQLPIVCSDIYGLKETVVHEKTGYKFNSKKKSDFYKYLDYLIIYKKKRLNLGLEGRKLVMEKFEKKTVIKEYLKFYKKILCY